AARIPTFTPAACSGLVSHATTRLPFGANTIAGWRSAVVAEALASTGGDHALPGRRVATKISQSSGAVPSPPAAVPVHSGSGSLRSSVHATASAPSLRTASAGNSDAGKRGERESAGTPDERVLPGADTSTGVALAPRWTSTSNAPDRLSAHAI